MADEPHHASFDVVLAIQEESIQQILSLYFRFGKMKSRFSETDREIPLPGGETATIEYDFGLTEPELSFQPIPGDKVEIRTRLRGPLTIKAGPLDIVQRSVDVFLRLTLEVPITIASSGRTASLVFALSQANVTRRVLQLRQPGTRNRDLIVGALVSEAQIDAELATILQDIGDVKLDLPLADLGLPPESSIASALPQIRDSVLLIAANLMLDPSDFPLGVQRDLHDFTGGSSMAVVAHPRIIEKLLQETVDSTKAEMQENVDRLRYNEDEKLISDITLDNIHFDLRERHIKFWGQARKHNITIDSIEFNEATRTETIHATDGIDMTADFSFKLALKVSSLWNEYTKPFVKATAYNVSVHLPEGERIVVGVFQWVFWPILGWLGPAIRDGLRKAEAQTFKTLDRKLAKFDREGVWDLPIKDGVRMVAVTKSAKMGKTGVEFYYRLNAPTQRMGVGVSGWTTIHRHVSEAFTLKWVLTAEKGFANPDDPEVLILWTVKRVETDPNRPGAEVESIVEEKVLPFSALRNGRLDLPMEALPGSLGYIGWARIVRRPDLGDDVVLGESKVIKETKDRLDRKHPYVRWEHEVWRLRWTVRQGSEGAVRSETGWKIHRKSKIHRTAYPGRCAFADQISKDKTTEIIYLDALPFARATLTQRQVRRELCDYCFFGGPDKEELLI